MRINSAPQRPVKWPHGAARAAVLALSLAAAGTIGGCKADRDDITGSIPRNEAAKASPGELQKQAETLARQYDSRPTDPATAIAYARVLRAQTLFAQAVAVLQTAAAKNPANGELIGAYGKALADSGRLKEASDALARAHLPERPNWSILSAQGAVADQMGDHQKAQDFYAAALKIAPGEPSVLSNLGLSHALSRDLPQAETILREAAQHKQADQRVRQNLALVLALRGKFGEAEQTMSRDLPPEDAKQNVATIRQMIAESDTWRRIQSKPGKKAGKPARPG